MLQTADNAVGHHRDCDIELVASKSAMQLFIRLPRLLYRNMQGFVPPLDHERQKLIAPPAAPFLKSGQAAYWIASKGGRPVGRVSAQVSNSNPADETNGLSVGYFGCLDAVDDEKVVASLLETASGWLQDHGCRVIRGPFTLSINGETGLLISGQGRGGMILLPWHPEYLGRHVETAGFAKAMDVVSYTYELSHRAPFVDWLMERPLENEMPGVRVRALNRKNFRADMEIIRNVYNDAWKENWGFLPVSEAEAIALESATRDLLEPDCGVIVERNGRPVAAALLLPNLFEIIHDLDGKLLPFNWIKLAVRLFRKPYRSARILLFGVRPAESQQTHGPLLPAIILREFLKRAPRYKIEEIDMGWVLDHRSEIRNMLERTGAKVTRKHRVYERVL
ncbi:MAG: hypothetical protein AB3N20_22425 [Rhizobiaceae bacterium]